MISSSISSHQEVISRLQNRAADLETFQTYAPVSKFIEAFISDNSLTFLVADEDKSIFAMAMGENPVIPNCDRLSASRGVMVDCKLFLHRVDWDFYSIDTKSFANYKNADLNENDDEIKLFLKTHAQKSSVWPGNAEILFWGEIRLNGALVAVGALVKWRTGEVMFASIATHTDFRGKGLAKDLVSQMLARAKSMSIDHVGLGVFAENKPAKRAYESVGFKLTKEFSSYGRRSSP